MTALDRQAAAEVLATLCLEPRSEVPEYEEARRHVRVRNRIPAGGIEVPVKGLSFRGDLYPRNVEELRMYLNIGRSIAAEPWSAKLLKAGTEFRQAVEEAAWTGRLKCRLVRDRDNPVDPYAVTVWAVPLGEWGFLGYVPAKSHGAPNVAVARGIDEWETAGRAGPPPFACYVVRVRVSPENPDYPGIDVLIRPFRPRPAGDK